MLGTFQRDAADGYCSTKAIHTSSIRGRNATGRDFSGTALQGSQSIAQPRYWPSTTACSVRHPCTPIHLRSLQRSHQNFLITNFVHLIVLTSLWLTLGLRGVMNYCLMSLLRGYGLRSFCLTYGSRCISIYRLKSNCFFTRCFQIILVYNILVCYCTDSLSYVPFLSLDLFKVLGHVSSHCFHATIISISLEMRDRIGTRMCFRFVSNRKLSW